MHIPIQSIVLGAVPLDIVRLDECFGNLSGNKMLKLSYLVEKIHTTNIKKIISFGGAYSNHLFSLAHFCHQYKVACVGLVRGEPTSNATLEDCKQLGMEIRFIARGLFDEMVQCPEKMSDAPTTMVVPMGGATLLARKGVSHFFTNTLFDKYNTFVCSVGTATTLQGIASAHPAKKHIGVFSHRGNFLPANESNNISLHLEKAFGSFGSMNTQGIQFMNDFYTQHHIPLDVVYTSKSMYFLQKSIHAMEQPVLFVHTGGLQGNRTCPQLIF